MNIKKILAIVLIMMLIIVGMTTVRATTANEDMYTYFENVTYTVNGVDYVVSAEELVTLERYLSTHTLTSDQVTLIKNNIESSVAILNAEGTTNISKLSSSSKDKIEAYVQEVATSLGLTIKYTSADNAINVYENGTLLDVISFGQKSLVQTGHSYVPYIVAVAVAVIAVAIIYVVRKNYVK